MTSPFCLSVDCLESKPHRVSNKYLHIESCITYILQFFAYVLQFFRPMGIRVRIGPQHPLVCNTNRHDVTVFRMRLEKSMFRVIADAKR
jgi:hypothetical protein